MNYRLRYEDNEPRKVTARVDLHFSGVSPLLRDRDLEARRDQTVFRGDLGNVGTFRTLTDREAPHLQGTSLEIPNIPVQRIRAKAALLSTLNEAGIDPKTRPQKGTLVHALTTDGRGGRMEWGEWTSGEDPLVCPWFWVEQQLGADLRGIERLEVHLPSTIAPEIVKIENEEINYWLNGYRKSMGKKGEGLPITITYFEQLRRSGLSEEVQTALGESLLGRNPYTQLKLAKEARVTEQMRRDGKRQELAELRAFDRVLAKEEAALESALNTANQNTPLDLAAQAS